MQTVSNSTIRQRRKGESNGHKAVHDDGGEKEKSTNAVSLSDLILAISLIFGGCCSNVWSFEQLLRTSSHVGSAVTFAQMLFITCQSLPQFLLWNSKTSKLPKLLPRRVPLDQWALQVVVLTGGTLLNNWAFAYDVPLTLQIVFRSSGLPVSMLLGRLVLRKRYTYVQILSVLIVTFGVVLATTSRVTPSSDMQPAKDNSRYWIGISMLSASLLLTGILGVLQETTYKKFGPCWKEGVFYTHLLSLPTFAFLVSDIRKGFTLLANSAQTIRGIPLSFFMLGINLATQLVCVSGVNQFTSKVSSVSTNLVLTTRKAFSLCLSVWLFNSGWNGGLLGGAAMVFLGSFLYTAVTARR